jgi:hypothetical protein
MIVSEQRVPVNEEGLVEEDLGFRISDFGFSNAGGRWAEFSVLNSQFSTRGPTA